MNKKSFFPLIVLFAIAYGCSKDKNIVEENPTPIPVTFKIQPDKIGELRNVHLARQNGASLRIESETFTEEEFFLYAEAVLNSTMVDQATEPTFSEERIIQLPFQGEAYNAYALLDYMASAELAIMNDMAGVHFADYPQATKFIQLIDLDWSNGGEIYYIVGINPAFNPAPLSYNMTLTPNANCSYMVLNGWYQDHIIGFWNAQAFHFQYRPDHLFDPVFGSHIPGPNEPIPNTTYTELTRVVLDYANPQDRVHYNAANFNELWHRVVPSESDPAPCLPDIKNGSPRYHVTHGTATAIKGTQLNPNQYHPWGNPNGLVMIGFSVVPELENSRILGFSSAPPEQTEHWHKVTYIYGRQTIYTGVPISNE